METLLTVVVATIGPMRPRRAGATVARRPFSYHDWRARLCGLICVDQAASSTYDEFRQLGVEGRLL
jgi:hypothetical protein